MTNTPIVELASEIAPASTTEVVDLSAMSRPAAAQPYATTQSYQQANLPALDQLDLFIDANWHCTRDDLSHTAKIVIRLLSDYINKMGPTSTLNPQDKARQQSQLFKVITLALNCEPDQSLVALRIIMFLINGYKTTVFSDRYALEASDLTAFTRDEHRTFRLVVTLLISTANPVTRKAVLKRQVDLAKVVKTLATQKMQDNLIRFYNII